MKTLISKCNLTYINNELFVDDTPTLIVGEGEESRVFLYHDKVYKIYRKNPRKNTANIELLDRCLYVDTSRILLPKDLIFKNNEIVGEVTNYIDNNTDIGTLSKSKLVGELALLKDDLITLSKNDIRIGDLRESNYLCDGEMYLIDVGDYTLVNNEHNLDVNLKIFNEFFMYDIFKKMLADELFDKKQIESFYRKEKFKLNENYKFIDQYLIDCLRDKEDLKCYVKRIIS